MCPPGINLKDYGMRIFELHLGEPCFSSAHTNEKTLLVLRYVAKKRLFGYFVTMSCSMASRLRWLSNSSSQSLF